MLKSLTIKDFAIIDELEVEFAPGLNAMTGETGAGKTIIVEALKLVLGARASTEIVRSGKERASVTAVFDASGLPGEISTMMEAAGIEGGGEIIIHRVVGAQGKGRIAVNGVPTTAAVLRSISAHLVDISSQHENQILIDETKHASVLDEFGALGALHGEYLEAHRNWFGLARDVAELKANERSAREKLEFLKFQLSEIDSAEIRPGEYEELLSNRSRVKHSALLMEKSSSANAAISGEDGSALAAVSIASQMLEACEEFEPKAKGWRESLSRARIELEETAREIDNYLDGFETGPEDLEAIEDRIHLIKGLVRKHGGSVEDLLKRREELADEVGKVENYDELLEEKQKELSELGSVRAAAAKKLYDARRKAAAGMSKRVASELSELSMAKTEFMVRVEKRDEADWDELGPDRVEFMISPNVGEPLMPLARIASGGELSRLMLAIKGALAKSGAIAGTSVFDEVDSGIGGAVAAVVGKKLKDLSSCRQVICITHLPQVAACATFHLRISKGVKDGRTATSLSALEGKGRVTEIARMLGGEKMTDVAVKHAEEMLKESSS